MNQATPKERILSITAEERKAITDPLYKAGVTALLKYGYLKLEGDESP